MLPVGTAEEAEPAFAPADDAALPVGTAEESEAVALLDDDAPWLSAGASKEEAEMTIVLLNDDDPVWRVREGARCAGSTHRRLCINCICYLLLSWRGYDRIAAGCSLRLDITINVPFPPIAQGEISRDYIACCAFGIMEVCGSANHIRTEIEILIQYYLIL